MKKWGWDFILNLSIIIWCLFIVFVFWYKFYANLDVNFIVSEEPIKYTEEKNECYIEEENEPYFFISDSEREVIQYIVAGEAKGESLLGKMAVAQCILNAMKQDDLTASEVRRVYQYSGWDDELQYSNPKAWEEVCHAVWCVFDNGEVVTQENILWFYNPNKAEGKFHNTQKFVLEIGNHRFYAPWEEE